MDYLVEFLESGGARIIKDPLLISKKKSLSNVLLNPDLTHLKGVSPSFWVKEGDTIGTLHPNDSLKIVMDSLTESHSFDSSVEAPLSLESKFILKVDEIDTRRKEDMHNLMKAMLRDKNEYLEKLHDLDDKYSMIISDLDHQLLKKQKQLKLLCLIYIIGMILVKFL